VILLKLSPDLLFRSQQGKILEAKDVAYLGSSIQLIGAAINLATESDGLDVGNGAVFTRDSQQACGESEGKCSEKGKSLGNGEVEVHDYG